jgi:ABC-type transport system involved in multi-copper enzyme maturation permease subunit
VTGAILKREIVVPGRKQTIFVVRGAYTLVLLGAVGIVFLVYLVNMQAGGTTRQQSQFITDSGERLFYALVSINMLGCLVFTPAFVASAISQEKDQRTIQDLFLTEMSATEIVFSKLAGRLGQVLMLLGTGLPLVAIGSLLGRVSGTMVVALAMMTLLWLMTAGSFTLLISVLVRRTRDAILGSYALGTILLTGLLSCRFFFTSPYSWLDRVLDSFNPFTILSAATSGTPALAVWQLIGETSLTLGMFSGVCVLVSVLLLRPLGVRQLEVKARKGVLRLRRRVRQSPEKWPMLWKEQHFAAAGNITRLLHLLGLLATLAIVVAMPLVVWNWFTGALEWLIDSRLWYGAVRVLIWPAYISMLLTSAAAFASERERASWDAVLTSPLDAAEIVWGKLAGCLWEVRWWFAAIALTLVGSILVAIGPQPLASVEFQTPVLWRLLQATALVFTGSIGAVPGIVGLAGNVLFLVGLGLRVSLSSKTSGKSLATTLMIWMGSGIAFWIGVYMLLMVVFLGFLAINRGAPGPWVNSMLTPFLAHLAWIGPVLIGAFWGAIGAWLLRQTVVRFDELASRMENREVVRFEALPTVDVVGVGIVEAPIDAQNRAPSANLQNLPF